MGLPRKYRGWIIAAATVMLVMVFYVIGGIDQKNDAKRQSKSTPSAVVSSTSASLSASPSPSASTASPSPSASSPEGSLNWSEELYKAGGTPALDAAVRLINSYSSVCTGQRAKTAPYAGKTHPLVIVGPFDEVDGPAADPLGDQWEHVVADHLEYRFETGHSIPSVLRPRLVDQVQLVACVTEKLIPAASCGSYTRSSDGVSGELRLTKGTATIRVVAASTGVEVARTTVERAPPKCTTSVGFQVAMTDPPWVLDGETPTLKEAHDFLLSFTTGPAQ